MEKVFIKKYWDEENVLFYLHYEDGLVVRQIEITPDKDTYLSVNDLLDKFSTKGACFVGLWGKLSNSPFGKSNFDADDFITEQEFDELWNYRQPKDRDFFKWGRDSFQV